MNNISFTKGIFNSQWNLSEEKIGTNFWNTHAVLENKSITKYLARFPHV